MCKFIKSWLHTLISAFAQHVLSTHVLLAKLKNVTALVEYICRFSFRLHSRCELIAFKRVYVENRIINDE